MGSTVLESLIHEVVCAEPWVLEWGGGRGCVCAAADLRNLGAIKR
jgi:hypothetical protein